MCNMAKTKKAKSKKANESGPTSSSKKTPSEKKGSSANEDQLREAIRQLGGDEDEDLRLIQGLDDDQEVEEEEKKDFSVEARKELEAFIKNLGLDKKFEEAEEETEEEDSMEEESTEEVEDSSKEEEEDESGEDEEEDQVQVEEVSSSTGGGAAANDDEKGASTPNFHFLKTKPTRTHCLVKTSPTDKWHSLLPLSDNGGTSGYWLSKLEKYAESLLELEKENFDKKQKSRANTDSELAYVQTVLKSGSLGDKISAHAVLLQVIAPYIFTVRTTA